MLTVLQTVESFQTLVSKDRFLKQKDFALKMQSMFGSTYSKPRLIQIRFDRRFYPV